ncbi:hypothetical protein ACLKA6_018555 [Drosophila palustris]
MWPALTVATIPPTPRDANERERKIAQSFNSATRQSTPVHKVEGNNAWKAAETVRSWPIPCRAVPIPFHCRNAPECTAISGQIERKAVCYSHAMKSQYTATTALSAMSASLSRSPSAQLIVRMTKDARMRGPRIKECMDAWMPEYKDTTGQSASQ